MLNHLSTPFIRKIIGSLGIVALIGCLGNASAQSNDNRSPYSRFGYGTLQPQSTAGARGMGNIGIGLRDGMITTPSNPASYTTVDSLTFIFDAGVSLRGSLLYEGNRSDSRLLGNLDYITMLFPLGRYMAMSAGILPYSSTGYSFGSLATLEGSKDGALSLRSYSGQGYYNTLYLGVGGKPFGTFSIGTNVGFLFGNTTHERQIVYQNQTAYNNVNKEHLELRGLKLDFGVQYELALDTLSNQSLVLGAVVTPGISLHSEYIQIHQRVGGSGSDTISSDTTNLKGAYTLPLHLGIGASYRLRNKLMVGADVKLKKWTSANFPDNRAQLQDQWVVNTGVEWQPNYRARSLFSRTKYRFGLQGATSYIDVPSGTLGFSGYYELGASLGMGIPLVDRRSVLNLGIEYRHLLPKVSGMVKEHYMGITLGLSFNEGWFKKARVN